MENFMTKVFRVETIEHPKKDNLKDILDLISDEYCTLMCNKYEIKEDKEILYKKILDEMVENLSNFTKEEHKSFYDLYNGVVEYSDENLYINLKKFSALGYIFLFTTNGGKLYNFKMPDEIMDKYEELLRSM